jgi:carotenoid cleavage dioxygenase-like enzyme
LVFDLAAVMRGGSLLSWQPDRGTRVAFMPRDGSAVQWIDIEPFWVWHFANAFDSPDGTVTIDYVEHSYPGGFAQVTTPNRSVLARATCNPVTGAIRRTQLGDSTGLEFPRVDDRLLTKQHNWISTVGKSGSDTGDLDSLWFHNLATDTDIAWSPGVAIGEPIYIPGTRHDYWGAIGTDPSDMRSRFYLLAADDPSSGPLATVELPTRVPAGLHGSWIEAQSTH